VNQLVLQGIPFRDAYKKVAAQIADGTFVADEKISHSHQGSIGNLCNDRITEKMERVMKSFDFEAKEKAYGNLLKWGS